MKFVDILPKLKHWVFPRHFYNYKSEKTYFTPLQFARGFWYNVRRKGEIAQHNNKERHKEMKRVIDGKTYNTDTAERLLEWNNGHYTTDFDYCSETLYRTRAGNYFLYGEGGARSVYAESYTGGYGFGRKIVPMTRAEADTWVCEHGNDDDFGRIFG